MDGGFSHISGRRNGITFNRRINTIILPVVLTFWKPLQLIKIFTIGNCLIKLFNQEILIIYSLTVVDDFFKFVIKTFAMDCNLIEWGFGYNDGRCKISQDYQQVYVSGVTE